MAEWQILLSSGLIETYCLGFTSLEENAEVEAMAAKYPAVQAEIERVRSYIQVSIINSAIRPSPSIKNKLFKNIYRQEAKHQRHFVPLLDEDTSLQSLEEVLGYNLCIPPDEDFDNIFIQNLPSTVEVVNLAVWVKGGQEREIHEDLNEYIAILEGSCIMQFEDAEGLSYAKGDVIHIPPGLYHSAVITSEEPMIAIVQRQLIF